MYVMLVCMYVCWHVKKETVKNKNSFFLKMNMCIDV